jgi:hypothetical protein
MIEMNPLNHEKFTQETFIQWLNEQGNDTIAGKSQSAKHCPMANFIREFICINLPNRKDSFSVGLISLGIYVFNDYSDFSKHEMPVWVNKVAAFADSRQFGEIITCGEILKIIE